MEAGASIERATPADAPAVLRLLEAEGLPKAGFVEHIPTALVARRDGAVLGSAALEMYASGALLRSVAIDRGAQKRGLGRRLTEAAIDMARRAGVPAIYLLTTTAADYFPRFGFNPIPRDDVPPEVRQSIEFTSACPSSAIVMRKQLREAPTPGAAA